jgi:hypothetical protein
VLIAPSPNSTPEQQLLQQWRQMGSPGYKPKQQTMDWTQLTSLPSGRGVGADGSIGAGMSSTPEYKAYMDTANANGAAEMQAFNDWKMKTYPHSPLSGLYG